MTPLESPRRQWLFGRPLTERECHFLQSCFGTALATDSIRMVASLGHRSWSPYGHRISLVRAHFHAGSAREEVRLDEPDSAACLAHEALHVWQRQRGRRVTLEAIPLQAGYTLGAWNPYDYRRSQDPADMLEQFVTGNVEQQGKIFEDYIYARQSGRDITAFEAVARHVRASARSTA